MRFKKKTEGGGAVESADDGERGMGQRPKGIREREREGERERERMIVCVRLC
jgi:hypothetical protein